MPGQRPDRLLAGGEVGDRDRRHHAAVDVLRLAEAHVTDLDVGPAVLGERLGPVDDQVGPEPLDRQRLGWLLAALESALGDPVVEPGERAQRRQRDGIAVGEAGVVAGLAVRRVERPARRIVAPHQRQVVATEHPADPAARGVGSRPGHQVVVVQPHRDQVARRLHDVDRVVPVGNEPECRAHRRLGRRGVGGDREELVQLAGRDQDAVAVDDHPPPVAGQSPRAYVSPLHGTDRGALHGVDAERAERDAHQAVPRSSHPASRSRPSCISAAAPANESRTNSWPRRVSKSMPGAIATPVSSSSRRHQA